MADKVRHDDEVAGKWIPDAESALAVFNALERAVAGVRIMVNSLRLLCVLFTVSCTLSANANNDKVEEKSR
jgi:hypothetical protein